MFETFVVGPIGRGGLGIVRQCIDCSAAARPDAPVCPGYGPGCLIGSPLLRERPQEEHDLPDLLVGELRVRRHGSAR
jgi:hypothetical protein